MGARSGRRRRRQRRRLIKVAVAASVLLFLIISPFIVLALIGDREPAVVAVDEATTGAAVRAKRIAQQLRRDLLGTAEEASVAIDQDEINGLMAMVMRATSRVRGRVNVTSLGIEGALAIDLPRNPMGRYLNIRFGIEPSDYGLHMRYLQVGAFHFAGNTALDVGEALVNFIVGNEVGTQLRRSVKSVRVEGGRVTVVYRPMPDLKERVALFRRWASEMRDQLALVAPRESVRAYYEQLCRLGAELEGQRSVSLGYYLAEAFSLADRRVGLDADPLEENRAALMALAIFLGSGRFETFVGEVVTEELAHCRAYGGNVKLAGRTDLRLHFIYSAALKLISDSGVSFAIGEFKEMMDSGKGGSGFSFVDLAADRTGIRFAEVALDTVGGARRVQEMALQLVEERTFFPSIEGLPEGIPQAEFEERYGGVEGHLYREYVKDITTRFYQVPLYNRWL